MKATDQEPVEKTMRFSWTELGRRTTRSLSKPTWALLTLILVTGGHIYAFSQTPSGKYFKSPAGWTAFEIDEPSAADTLVDDPLVLCGRSGMVVIPMKSGYRVVDPRRGLTKDYDGMGISTASCSPDGRYLFVSVALRPHKKSLIYNRYNLVYFDLTANKRVEVFSGLTGFESMNPISLVSPNAKYVIGPKELGATVTLSGGETLKVIPSKHFEGMKFDCSVEWNGDGDTLITYESGMPRRETGQYLSKPAVKAFDVIRQKWTRTESDWLPLGVPGPGCAKLYAHRGRMFVMADTSRPGWHEGGSDAYQFVVEGDRLKQEKVWHDVSALSIARDGTVAFTKVHGVEYKLSDVRFSPSNDFYYEVHLEKDGGGVVFTRLEINPPPLPSLYRWTPPLPQVVVASLETVVAFTDPMQRSKKIFIFVQEPR